MGNIAEFRSCKTRMDVFWPKMYTHLREALVLAAFTSAHSDVSGRIHTRIVDMKNAYGFFFDVWYNIESDLRELYRTKSQYNKEILSNIARQLLLLFSTLTSEDNTIMIPIQFTCSQLFDATIADKHEGKFFGKSNPETLKIENPIDESTTGRDNISS